MKKKGQYRAGPPIAFWVPILGTKKYDFYMEPCVKFVLRINGSFSPKNNYIFRLLTCLTVNMLQQGSKSDKYIQSIVNLS